MSSISRAQKLTEDWLAIKHKSFELEVEPL
jgi:hypothetical protein